MADNGSSNGGPAWLKAAVQLGVPSLIALGLVYWITQTVTPKIEAQVVDTQAVKSMVTAHVDANGRTNAEMLFYLRSLCVNLARSAEDRARCVPPREP